MHFDYTVEIDFTSFTFRYDACFLQVKTLCSEELTQDVNLLQIYSDNTLLDVSIILLLISMTRHS